MVNIYLTGKLGRLFGKKWTLDVRSPAEAVRAIDINLKGKLLDYLKGEGAERFYKIAIQKKSNTLTKEELLNPSGQSDIYIMPTIRGAEKGWQKILAAVAIIVITYFTAGAGSAGAAGIFGKAASAVAFAGYSAGASLFIGGVTQLLTPVPKFNDSTADTKASFVFPGNSTTIVQGGGVPIAYGRVMLSPMPISISSITFDQKTTPSVEAESENEELPGGGYQ